MYKTISTKYNPNQKISILSSIPHGFIIVLTAEMVNDLHDKPKLATKISKHSPLTHLTDNPLDYFLHSDDQSIHNTAPTGITSPPPVYTKHSIRFNKMARLNFFPKQKQTLHHKTNQRTPTLHSSPGQNPTLPNYSSVTTTPNDYPADNTSVNFG